jgi:hypothetical protein
MYTPRLAERGRSPFKPQTVLLRWVPSVGSNFFRHSPENQSVTLRARIGVSLSLWTRTFIFSNALPVDNVGVFVLSFAWIETKRGRALSVGTFHRNNTALALLRSPTTVKFLLQFSLTALIVSA